MGSTKDTAQKQQEMSWFLKFREGCPACPRSTPEQPPPPAPDFRFPDCGVGIELTTYLLGQGSNGSRPRQLEVVRQEIVREAQLAYEASAKRCLQVSVIWGPDLCPGGRDQTRLVKALSETVASHTGRSVCMDTSQRIEPEDFQHSVLQQYIEEIGIYVLAEEGRSCWSSATGLSFGSSQALVKRFQDLLDRKEPNVATYLQGCREVWLLIVAEQRWFSSSIGSREPLLRGEFKASFSRVFVMEERLGEVFELTINHKVSPPADEGT